MIARYISAIQIDNDKNVFNIVKPECFDNKYSDLLLWIRKSINSEIITNYNLLWIS